MSCANAHGKKEKKITNAKSPHHRNNLEHTGHPAPRPPTPPHHTPKNIADRHKKPSPTLKTPAGGQRSIGNKYTPLTSSDKHT